MSANGNDFAVVQFFDESSSDGEVFSLIPTNWLKNDRQCYWPNSKKPARHLFKNRVEPKKDVWTLCSCKVRRYFKTYEEALEREMALSEMSSGGEFSGAETTTQKKQPKQKRNHLPTLREDSISPPPSMYSADADSETSSVAAALVVDQADTFNSEALDIQHLEFVMPQDATLIGNINENNLPTNLLQKILETVVETKMLAERNFKMLQEIKLQQHSKSITTVLSTNSVAEKFNLPLDSIQDIEKLEDELLDEDNSSQMINYLKTIGGKDCKNMLKRCLTNLFTNKLARLCSWTGARGNFRLSILAVITLLKDATGSQCGNTDSEFETILKEWFRMANSRYQRQLTSQSQK